VVRSVLERGNLGRELLTARSVSSGVNLPFSLDMAATEERKQVQAHNVSVQEPSSPA